MVNEQVVASRLRSKDGADYDTTSLRYSSFRYKVHRDYLAHVFRWGWAARYIADNAHRRVLEPGCGADCPLLRSLMQTVGMNKKPELYVGVDLCGIPYARERKTKEADKYVLREGFNFNERWTELYDQYGPTFDLAVSFEVIEHMTEEHGDIYLAACNALMPEGATLLLSTPVYNGHAAANHIREYEVDELAEKIERAGFEVINRYGTFASKPVAIRGIQETYPDQAEILIAFYEKLREFYSDDVLACFLAPAIPDHSRNNAWVCVKRRTVTPPR